MPQARRFAAALALSNRDFGRQVSEYSPRMRGVSLEMKTVVNFAFPRDHAAIPAPQLLENGKSKGFPKQVAVTSAERSAIGGIERREHDDADSQARQIEQAAQLPVGH